MGSRRWILATAGVVVLVAVMINLGFWQLRRLEEKRAVLAELTARAAMPVAPVTELADDPGAVHRRASATGVFEPAGEVTIPNRSHEGSSGVWVVTPLILADGRALAVNRGFVPLGVIREDPDAVEPPPAGPLTVTGLIRAPERSTRFGLDPAALADRWGRPTFGFWLALEQPTAGRWPTPIDPPVADEGPHLSYAVQWFTFSAIAAGGWVMLTVRDIRREGDRRRRATASGAGRPPGAAGVSGSGPGRGAAAGEPSDGGGPPGAGPQAAGDPHGAATPGGDGR